MVTNRGALIGDWAGYMRRRGLSAGTIDVRLRLVQRWLVAFDEPWLVSADDVDRWLDSHDQWLVASTRYSAVSHLHAFYVWAIRAGHTAIDPTVTVERPRLQQRLPRPIHPADLAVAVAVAGPAMRAALWLMATSGLRCCEVARLRWDDVHDGTARVMGKGSKERVVPLHPSSIDALDLLDRSSVHVFAGWQSSLAHHPGLNVSRRVGDHLHALGISATPHMLRHYAGTKAWRVSGDLRKVQKLLGHASPATTAMYVLLDVDDLIDVVNAIEIPAA